MAAPPPVSGTLRRLGASLLALGRIRLELLALEIQEEKERLALLLFWSLFSAMLCGFGLMFLALWITAAWWDTHRVLALAVSCLAFVGLALFGVWRVRKLLSREERPLAASLAELRDDEDGLRGPPVPP